MLPPNNPDRIRIVFDDHRLGLGRSIRSAAAMFRVPSSAGSIRGSCGCLWRCPLSRVAGDAEMGGAYRDGRCHVKRRLP